MKRDDPDPAELVPALNILWAMRVQVQLHPCRYHERLLPAIDGIVRVREFLRHHNGLTVMRQLRAADLQAAIDLLNEITTGGCACFYAAKMPAALKRLRTVQGQLQ